MTKNRTRTPVYLDPGMHPGLEVKGLITMRAISTNYHVRCENLGVFIYTSCTMYNANEGFYFVAHERGICR